MPTEMEFVNFKKFVEDLPEATEYASGDKSVASNENDGPRKFDAEKQNVLKFFVVVENSEYAYAVIDADGRFLFGVKKDGSFEFAKGLPSPIANRVEELVSVIDSKVDKVPGKSLIDAVFAGCQFSTENPEYLWAVTDENGVFLLGVKKDGSFEFAKGLPTPIFEQISLAVENKVDKEIGKGLIDTDVASMLEASENLEYAKVVTDSEGRVIFGVKKDGTIAFLSRVEFNRGCPQIITDHSDEKTLDIPSPRKAFINFSGISAMPTTKTDDFHAYMEFYDGAGNYFKKKVIANAQGNSSLGQPKKNISIDICNDDWEGDDSFKLKIGDWIVQDSFHIKAYHTDYFRGSAVVGYQIFDAIQKTRDYDHDRTWKDGLVDFSNVTSGSSMGVGVETDPLLRLENGARCFPDGFPCDVYLNGVFYGIFSFQLKKHRDNYCMDKGTAEHIHLDGNLDSTALWDGSVSWSRFEIRNPKNLYCTDGSEYDGDNPSEIVDSETAEEWISAGLLPNGKAVTSKIAKNLRMTAKVRGYIEDLAAVSTTIHYQGTDELKRAEFEKVFNVDNLIDYQIFGDAVGNTDGFAKNWQWTTWDGVHWFVNPYDLDVCFGNMWTGEFAKNPLSSHIRDGEWRYPNYNVLHYYTQRLEARYAELRNLGILSKKFFMDKFNEWMLRVGFDSYKKEYDVWKDVPCNRLLEVDDDYWELVVDENGKPVISTSREGMYDPATEYVVGDECVAVMNTFDITNDPGWYYTFRCVNPCQGVVPAKFGYCDSIFRYSKWVEEELDNMDLIYNYGG